jgi:hypothetical protein
VADTPSDSMTSRLRRNESRREPATIDLSATEVQPDVSAETASARSAPAEGVSAAGPGESGEPHESSVRPTPDEVIPTDDSHLASADATLPFTPDADLPPNRSSEHQRRGSGFAPLLAAGIIGGLLGAGATMFAENWWRPRESGVDQRLAAIEQRVAAPQTPVLGQIESRMARLEADTKALGERLNATQALAERSVKDTQEALNRPRPEAGPGPEAAANASVLADLATRVGAIEKQTQERAQASTGVQDRIATFQEQAQATANAAQVLERRIADQDQRLAALAKQFSERGPDAMASSLRVTLADRLGDALQDGAPLGQILGVLRRLDVKPDTLKALEPYAQSGPPSTTALAQEFKPLGPRMIAATRTPSGDWGERVWHMLDKVVTVRAVGDAKSSDVTSLVARIDDALARDAVTEAAAAWDALPDSARRIAPDWGAKLKQRAAADAAAQKIYAEALSALEASTR